MQREETKSFFGRFSRNMKKAALILLCTIGLISPKFATSAGKKNDLVDRVIEKIEETYQALRASAPFVKANGVPVAQNIRFIQPADHVTEDYGKLRQIALVRHGEPDMDKTGKYTCDEANQFLECYDSVCIIVPEKPFFTIEEEENVKVFSSPINRAFSTAQYLCGTEKDITVLPEFREFENRIGKSDSKKRKGIKFWTTTSRVKWMLGGGKKKGIETFSQARKRARQAAHTLDDASAQNPKVLLTAHGMVNRYIKKNLEKMGWRVVADTGSDYFGTTILVKVDK